MAADTVSRTRLDLARQTLAAGNLTAADVLCRFVLDKNPGDCDALNLLGVVAAQIRLYDQSINYFRRAAQNGSADALKNLSHAKALMSQEQRQIPKHNIDKYLVIKAWGFGFWSDVSSVLGGLLLAEITRRRPVIHWGANSRFGDGTAKNGFDNFF